MAGIRITDLPVVTEILNTDELLVARGETTRKAFGTALVTKQYAAELLSIVQNLSANILIPVNNPEAEVHLYFDAQTKQISADIVGIIQQINGGTGYNTYSEFQTLIANAFGVLQKLTLLPGRGISLSATELVFEIKNTEPHIPTNLSTSYTLTGVSVHSSTGLSANAIATFTAATPISAGIMSAQDKTRLNQLFEIKANTPFEFNNNFTVSDTISSNLVVVNSSNATTVTLPSSVSTLSHLTFVRANSGSVTFVPAPNVTIYSTVNSTHRRISCINGSATAYFKKTNEWHLVGDLESTWDKKLTGPNSVDDEQKIGIYTNGPFDTLYYKNDWNTTNIDFKSMVIQVNGTTRAVVDFTGDRIGSQFGYKLGPGLGGFKTCDEGPTYFGTFIHGTVNLTL